MNDQKEGAFNPAYENTDDADDDTDYFEFTSTVLISGLDEIQLVPEQAKEANRCLAQLNFHLNRISFLKDIFSHCFLHFVFHFQLFS